MSTEMDIPKNQHELVPGKGKSLAQIDEAQRKKEAVIEIQRAYRGVDKFGSPKLTPGDRWKDALKRAKVEATMQISEENEERDTSPRKRWRNAKNVITGLQQRDESDLSDDEIEVRSEGASDSDAEEKKLRLKHLEKMKKGQAGAKAMESPYFLEMIDPHHRYGSNLKAYHTYWMKKTDNKDNFFHWLDEGDGRNVDLSSIGRSRETLDSEKVRYLTREKRLHYLVKVDENGLLRWAKNGELIDTTLEYKDSEEGIVRADDESAQWVPPGEEGAVKDPDSDDDDSSTSVSSAVSGTERADKYVNDKPGLKKVFLISPSAVMNRLLRKTTRKNTWIYVTDRSYRLYVGMKQSGSFQHSSFLHGAKVTSAGLITVRNGQLRKLSPLSGHYRCSTKHFRHFLHAMELKGVDMSKVYVSRSYTIMIGMEAIGRVRKVKKKIKEGVEKIVEKVTHNSAEMNGTNEVKANNSPSGQVNGEQEGDVPLNGDVNTVSEGMEKLQVSKDIKV